MKQQLSRKKLYSALASLRETVTEGRNSPPSYVIFFNSRSFYCHLKNQPCGETTVSQVLKTMEPCVPLALTDHSLHLFLKACKEEDVKRLSEAFMDSSKGDFLLLLRSAAYDEEKWQAVLTLCDGLRLQNM